MAIVLAAVTALDLGYNNGPSSSSALSTTSTAGLDAAMQREQRAIDAMQPATRNATVQR